MSTVAVVVSVAIILWADIFHLIVASALGAALSRAFAGSHQPDDNMRVCWATGAANVLLITERLDNNRVLERAFFILFVSPKLANPQAGSLAASNGIGCGFWNYLSGSHPMDAYQRYPRPASFPRFPIVPDQSTVRDR